MPKYFLLFLIIFLSCNSFYKKPNAWFVPFIKENIKTQELDFELEENFVYDIYIEKGKADKIIIDNELYPFNEKNGKIFKNEEDAKKFSLYRTLETTKKKLEKFSTEDINSFNKNFITGLNFINYSFLPKVSFKLPVSFGKPIETTINENKIDGTDLKIKSTEYTTDKSVIKIFALSDYREMIKKTGIENEKKNLDLLLKKLTDETKIKKEDIIEPGFVTKRFYSYIYKFENTGFTGYYYIFIPVKFDENEKTDFRIKYILFSKKDPIIISAEISIESIFLNMVNNEIKSGTLKINFDNEIPGFTEKLLSEESMLLNYSLMALEIIKSIAN